MSDVTLDIATDEIGFAEGNQDAPYLSAGLMLWPIATLKLDKNVMKNINSFGYLIFAKGAEAQRHKLIDLRAACESGDGQYLEPAARCRL